MRLYNSPVQLKPSNIHKKSSINFIKNVAAPKIPKTQQALTPTNHFPNQNHNVAKSLHILHQKYASKQAHTLTLAIHLPSKPQSKSSQIKSSIIHQPIRASFPYNNQTEMKQLIAFIHSQVQNNMIFIKSQNVYVDYILGLREFRVARLVEMLKEEGLGNGTQLEVTCCDYPIVQQENYLRNFEIVKCVGSGGFSKVFLVRGFGRLMAMKVINKEYILSNDKANIINNEKTILSICSDHPFVTKLEAAFETSNFLIFAMEFCNGGELFNLLRKVRRMKEEEAQFYFLQTLCAIVFLHRKGIVYRDIKPENIIIDYEGHVRLADYGLSKLMEERREGKTYSFCGSAEYMAPEMLLKKGHSYQIDFYCLGALLYELVAGLPPYYSRNQNQLFANIIHNELQFPPQVQFSPQLKHFLTSLLQKQVDQRYNTIQQILNDPWMKNVNLEHVLEKQLKPPFTTDMFAYNFDDADFADDERDILYKLKLEQGIETFDNPKFPDFFYESKEISDLKSVITNSKNQGIFIRSLNHGVGEFTADSYVKTQSRRASNSGSLIMLTQHSREPSINRLEQSGIITIPNSSQITRRTESINIFTGEPLRSHGSQQKINYLPGSIQLKPQLGSVRSLEQLACKASHNRLHQRVPSITKTPVQHPLPYTNIYTSHKQALHPFGIKLTTQNSSYSTSNLRASNYYSVQKSSSRGSGIRLDINDLRIKNQRNFSVERPRDNFSVNNLTIGGTPHSRDVSLGYLKHAVSTHQIKGSYIDGLREKNLSTKVKKCSMKNGQKISMSMLNNMHYRH